MDRGWRSRSLRHHTQLKPICLYERSATTRKLFADRIYRIGEENAYKIGPHINRVESEGHKVVRLNLGEPAFDMPAFVRDEVKRQLNLGNTRYCDPQGILSVRKAIASQMKQMRGLNVSPEQVVVFPGGKPSIGFCLHA